jgi:hypothetical protein
VAANRARFAGKFRRSTGIDHSSKARSPGRFHDYVGRPARLEVRSEAERKRSQSALQLRLMMFAHPRVDQDVWEQC